jgi:hypothetical protein
MNKNLLKRLLLNVIETLNDRLGNDSCNDIFSDEPLLKGISKEELKEINDFWVENFPDEVNDYGTKIHFNTQILNCVEKDLKENNRLEDRVRIL